MAFTGKQIFLTKHPLNRSVFSRFSQQPRLRCLLLLGHFELTRQGWGQAVYLSGEKWAAHVVTLPLVMNPFSHLASHQVAIVLFLLSIRAALNIADLNELRANARWTINKHNYSSHWPCCTDSWRKAGRASVVPRWSVCIHRQTMLTATQPSILCADQVQQWDKNV